MRDYALLTLVGLIAAGIIYRFYLMFVRAHDRELKENEDMALRFSHKKDQQ